MTIQNTIPSPYHFVPLADDVHFPEWQEVNQDFPIKEGVSGILTFQLKNHTPLMIGSDAEFKENDLSHKCFFRTKGDNPVPAIPGTTIKGLLRNWLEIATHSKLNDFNDLKHSYRNLNSKEYTSKLTDFKTVANGLQITPRTKTGWLKYEENQWRLYPCEHHRIKNSIIEQHFLPNGINTSKHRDAVKLYKDLGGIKSCQFKAGEKQFFTSTSNKNNRIFHSKVEHIGAGDNGFLIVTGQVSNAKHMNFIFESPEIDPIPFYDEKVMDAFLSMNKQKQKNLKAEEGNSGTQEPQLTEFDYLVSQQHKHGVPIFYLEQASKVKYIGTAQMFRLPYEHTIGELRPKQHQENTSKKDFVQLLFGDITDDNTTKGRISIGLATLDNPENAQFEFTAPLVLGAPKSSFYPAYLQQNQTPKSKESKYQTYDHASSDLAGRKRYLLQQRERQNTPLPKDKNGKTNYKVASKLEVLIPNHSFTGKIRFHNLIQEELGALILALKIHQSAPNIFFHNIGMAKPLGYGRISFTDLSLNIKNNDTSLEAYESCFLDYIKTQIGSEQSLELLRATQTLEAEKYMTLSYPTFSNRRDENDFGIYLDKNKPKYQLESIDEILSHVNDAVQNENRRIERAQREILRDLALAQATDEEKVFVGIRSLIDEAGAEVTKTMVGKMQNELKTLLTYLGESEAISNAEITVFNEILQQIEAFNKPKLTSITKKMHKILEG